MQLSIDTRPIILSDVYGQPTVVKELTTRIKTGKLPKAFLMKGPSGVGKSTCSKIVAMSLVCDHVDSEGNPCGTCSHCKDIINENYALDVSVLDGGSDSGKASVVEFGKMSQMNPMYSRSSVYIIEEADQLSSSAKNSLLKVLEKPSENVYFILLSMVNGGIPKAIADRCQTFKFNEFTTRDIMFGLKNIMERMGIWGDEDIPRTFFTDGLRTIAESSDGSLRNAVQTLDKCLFGKFFTKEDIKEHLGIISSSTVNELLMDASNLKRDFFTKLDSLDINEVMNLAYNNLSDALQYRITRIAKNDYFEEQTKALANSPYVEDVLGVFEEVMSTPIYMKKQLLGSRMALLFLKKSKSGLAIS